MINKICKTCGKELPATIEFFYSKPSNKDGLKKECRVCENARVRERNRKNRKPKVAKVIGDTKLCVRCGEYLPFDMFYKAKNTIDGLRCYCKKCQKGIYTDYMSVPENKAKAYEVHKEYMPRYEEAHKEERKEQMRIRSKRRYNKTKEVVADLTLEQWEECLKFFDNKDAYTGLPMNIVSQDHIVPVSKGGGYTKNNIVPCERNINSSKVNNNMEEWFRRQPFFSEERLNKINLWIERK